MAASSGKGKRSKNFTHEETAVLLDIWSDSTFQKRFESSYRNSFLWVDIARHMQERGFERDGNECKNKIRNLKTEYLRLKRNFTAAAKPPDWMYWEKLHSVFGAKTDNFSHESMDRSNTELAGNTKLEHKMIAAEQDAVKHQVHSPVNSDGAESEEEEYESPLDHVQPILEEASEQLSPNWKRDLDVKKTSQWFWKEKNGTVSDDDATSSHQCADDTKQATRSSLPSQQDKLSNKKGESSWKSNGVKRNRNFSHEETLSLLEIWGEDCIQEAFKSAYRHSTLWATIARLMQERGFERDGNECKIKIGNLRSEYQRLKKSSKSEHPEWPYWDHVHTVLGSRRYSSPMQNTLDTLDSDACDQSLEMETGRKRCASTDRDSLQSNMCRVEDCNRSESSRGDHSHGSGSRILPKRIAVGQGRPRRRSSDSHSSSADGDSDNMDRTLEDKITSSTQKSLPHNGENPILLPQNPERPAHPGKMKPNRRKKRKRENTTDDADDDCSHESDHLLQRLVEIEEQSFKLLQKRTENETQMTAAATKFFSSTMHFLMSYTGFLFAQGGAGPSSNVTHSFPFPNHVPASAPVPDTNFSNVGNLFPSMSSTNVSQASTASNMPSCAMAGAYTSASFSASPPVQNSFPFSPFPSIASQFQFPQANFSAGVLPSQMSVPPNT